MNSGVVAICLLALSISAPVSASPPGSVKKVFYSPSAVGYIGVTEERPVDNPADNIFHVVVDQQFDAGDRIWLIYDLDGAQDHTDVARSINDQLAVGGQFVRRRSGWATQRERISATWLRQGDNVIRFTLPADAPYAYSVRNVKIEVEETLDQGFELVVNQTSQVQFGDKAFIKGFVGGSHEGVQLRLSGSPLTIYNREFAVVVETSALDSNCKIEIEAVHENGTSSCHPVAFGENAVADYEFPRESAYHRVEEPFDNSDAHSIAMDAAKLEVPAGSLDLRTLISITSLRDVDVPALDDGMVNVTRTHEGFRFLPHGTKFLNEVKLTIPYDVNEIPDGYTEQDIRTYYFNEQTHHWVDVDADTTLAGEAVVISRTAHFTDYINAIVKVPESPEVAAYNSTSIKGIQAANPTARVNLINPPKANNTGGANLSYPLTLPGGRMGVKPELNIAYSSTGGNGWLGLGWNLQIPAVGIETRWGVPRYDGVKETETYSMNGDMLAPVAHRSEPVDRSAGDKQFYPRNEGAFQKIIRHGSNPESYWWEVTDKGGTRYFYGGGPSGFDKNSVLRTDEKNDGGAVALWHLSESRDLNGNTIRYHYTKVEDKGVANGTVDGYQIYPQKITYTGTNGNDGKFSVVFTRDRELSETPRADVQIAANLGFKMVTADLLRKIEVQYDARNIRSYELVYKQGEFNKTLLSSIREYDAAGNIFTTHELDYYNDVNEGGTVTPFEDEENWTVPYDTIDGGLLVSKAGFNDETSVLSGNKSTDFGFGMTVTVGLNDGQMTSKSNTLGGSFGVSQSDTEGRLLMLDVNGDGLPDKVMSNRGRFWYRPNESRPGGEPKFGAYTAMKNGGEFFKERSKTFNAGFEAQGGFGDGASAFIGLGGSKTTSVTSVYFTDVNGDQLPDLIKNGLAYFNHLDRETGVITFSTSSEGTPSPIVNGSGVSGTIFEVDPAELEADIEANPLHDVVRLWRAPETGHIKVSGNAQLILSGTDAPNADGVNLVVQQNQNVIHWTRRINANDSAAYPMTGMDSLAVTKGDRLYFRVQSVFNGEVDEVKWAPVIKYTDKDVNLLNANNQKIFRYSAHEDFVLSAPMEVATPIAGRVKIESVFEKPVTTDSVLVEIIHRTTSGDQTIFTTRYSWNQQVSVPIDLDVTVAADESFLFRVTSSTNVAWPLVKWKPVISYIESFDPSVPEVTRDGMPVISYTAVPKFSIFARVLNETRHWKVNEQVDTLLVIPQLTFQPVLPPTINIYTGDVTFSVKKRDTLVLKKQLKFVHGVLSPADTFKIGVAEDDSLYFEFHGENETLLEGLTEQSVKIRLSQKDSVVSAGLYTVFKKKADIIYGPLYRHWGHFGYNGNKARANAPINEFELRLSPQLEKEYKNGDVGNTDDLQGSGAYEPAKDNFIMFYARGGDQTWAGYDQFTFVDGLRISSSRMGDDDLTPAKAFEGGGSAIVRGINKISKSLNGSLSGGVSVPGINGSANTSIGSSKVLADFMDMNGDRYPDIVTDKGIQYTRPTGALDADYKTFVTGNVQESATRSSGISSGGFVKPVPRETATRKQAGRSDVGSAKASGTLSGNVGKGDNVSTFAWMDINGDGLPDRVHANGSAQLNLGYSLAAAEPWTHGSITVSESTNAGAGIGFSKGVGSESASISGGIGLSRSDNETAHSLMDVNGDGLPDQLKVGGSVWDSGIAGGVQVRLNNGNSFTPFMDWAGSPKINESSSTGESANVAFTVCFSPFIVPVKICINPNVNAGQSISRDEARIADVDGDGDPDYLVSSNDGDLTVKRSAIGRTNLLKGVKRPMGAMLAVDYARMGNTYDLPNHLWVLSSVTVVDGFKDDGVDTLLTTFAYENGKHDRLERDFYGFEKVTTHTHDTGKPGKPVYTSVTQTFVNDNYYEKGLLLEEEMTDGAGSKFVRKGNKYELRNILTGVALPESAKTDPAGSAFAALTEESQLFFEGQSSAGKETRMTYGYDAMGNVTAYTDFGDEGDEDNISAVISYHDVPSLYLVGTAKSITVTSASAVLRSRESTIDPTTGDVTQIKQFLNESDAAVYDLEYNTHGLLTKVTRPENSTGQRLSFDYEYDGDVQTYVTKVSNSHGYSSESRYDVRFGEVLETTDMNGNKISYELDDVGRISSVTGPYENGAHKTIQFEYHPTDAVPWALTEHFDPAHPTNSLETVLFVDGMGRLLQTKKDVALFDGEARADKEMMLVSGRVIFDALGRVEKAYYPVTEAVGSQGNFNPAFDDVNPSETTYDVQDRALTVKWPDQTITTTEFGFATDRYGIQQFSTITTDANGRKTEQFTNTRGKVTSVKNYTSEKEIWTSFKYSAISEQIEATDDLGHTIFSLYDNLGRRVERRHPDAGTTTYSFDLAGNKLEQVTANLAADQLAIQYVYDFERPTEIIYPQNPENNVKYTYGEAGAPDNRAGKIVLQEDGSGAQEYSYGPLGEMVKNVRTIVLPKFGAQTYVTEWTYDTWNRLTSMIYPDGEQVDFTYNVGGLLLRMDGKKKSSTYSYVKQLGYDKFEQRVFLAYGNGTKTTYTYEDERRRLHSMSAETSAKRVFMDNVYTYDAVNNILNLKNNAPVPPSNLMGGSSEYTYGYDDLERLVSVQGGYAGANDEHSYTLAMSYNTVGSVLTKNQVHLRKGQEQKKTTYNFDYQYGDEQPHAPIHIGKQTYTYDANGNQTGWTDDETGQRRKVMWDEENRIRSVEDNGAYHHYMYDAAGERVWKAKSTGQQVFVNGAWKAGSGNMGNYVVYVNPYIVLRSGGYTKHYYIENQRIVSKLGGGWENSGQEPLKAGGGKVDFAGREQKVFEGIVKNLKFLGSDGQILTAGNSGKVPPGQINGTGNVTESFRYFYHPDHLGSTAYITDASGEVYQHLEYFAFGETFVEEHSNTNRTPYLFNGKELDEETGLYYYGARYYDARTSVWQSVDPQGERGPGWSPYNFNFNNPVRYIDPTGMWPDFSLSDIVHTSLDVVGLVPGLGEIADGVNAVIYLAEGNYTDAALSAAAMIPLAGAAATVAKLARKADKAITAVKTADKALSAIKAVEKAKDATKTVEKATDAVKAGEKLTDANKTADKAGVYEFKYKDENGKILDYTGQSKDIERRLSEHAKKKDIVPGTTKTHAVPGDKTDREIFETKLLDSKGGPGGTNGNIRRPVSAEREKLLRQTGKWVD